MATPKPTNLTTNDRKNSCLKNNSDVRSCLSFDSMWRAHPKNWDPPEPFPFRKQAAPSKSNSHANTPFAILDESESSAPLYGNQCAIRLSISLAEGGLPLDTFPKNRSEVHHVSHLDKKIRGALAAEELARWLAKALGNPEIYKKGGAFEKVKGRKGIILFRDYWTRESSELNGDHIDLWNGETMPGKKAADFIGPETEFQKAKDIWFWEIK